MAEKFKQEETTAEKLDLFLTRNRSLVLTIALALVVAIIAVVAVVVVRGKATEKGLAQVDAIYYALTTDADSLEGDALAARQDAALSQLAPLVTKGGIVGVRANMIAADLYFQKSDYASAKTAYLQAADAKKHAYTAALAYFNAAVAAESLQQTDDALAYYQKAADSEDFLLKDHALFNVGRVAEAREDFAAASDAYNKLNDAHPDSDWAKLAKTRLIALKANGQLDN